MLTWGLRKNLALAALPALLASCAWPQASNRHLMDEGYAINPAGDVNSAEVRLFVAERLKWHGMCPSGWAVLPCVKDGSCVQRTSRSVTVLGRCLP